MRHRLPGVARVNKLLANGERRTYYYAWRGGPLLKADDGRLLTPADPQFFVAYTQAHAARRKPLDGTMFNLLAEFRAASEFTTKSEKTKKDYRRYLRMIEEEFGDMTYRVIEDRRARAEFKRWRDTMAGTPRTADYAWSVLARVLSVAVDNGRISVNPCRAGGRLYVADRAESIWTEDQIGALLAVASRQIREALLLALWTGQRQGDLLRAPWSAYDGTSLRLRQGKTKTHVAIPAGGPLRAALDEMKSRRGNGTTMLTNGSGEPWTSDGFRTSWGKAVAKSGVTGLTFHDLRGTAVTRLALAGCTAAEIAGVTGHSLKDVETILDTHYLGGRIKLAESAVRKLDAKYGSGT